MKSIGKVKSIREKISEMLKRLWQDPEYREKTVRQMKKAKQKHKSKMLLVLSSEEFRAKVSEIVKKLWQNPEYRERNVRSRVAKSELKPNGLEKAVCELLQSYFPEEWRYVGDGKVFIAGFVPDFIHKEENWIIEVNGDYWHSFPEAREKDERKKRVYEKCGYKVLEIWESEFRANSMAVVDKVTRCFYGECALQI
jgi:hypothetical protein